MDTPNVNLESQSEQKDLQKHSVFHGDLACAFYIMLALVALNGATFLWLEENTKVASSEGGSFSRKEKGSILEELARASREASGGLELSSEEKLNILEDLNESAVIEGGSAIAKEKEIAESNQQKEFTVEEKMKILESL